MQKPSLPSQPQRHLRAEDWTWLNQAAKEARKEWESVRRQGGPAEKAQALACLSSIICDLEGPAAGLRLSRRAHRLWQTAGDPRTIVISSAVMAVRLLDAGYPQEARCQSAEALEGMRRLDLEYRHLGVLRCLGKDFLVAGYAAEAQAWYELALEQPEEAERAGILVQLSRALDLQGNLPEARDRMYEACAAFHRQGEAFAMATAMLGLARLELRCGLNWHAATLCQEAHRIFQLRHFRAEATEAQELYRLCHGGQRRPPAGH